MKTLPRDEALDLWDQYWANMKHEWFKVEVLQDYTGEDDCPSLQAWLAGNKQKSLELLAQAAHNWRKQCQEKHNQGVSMRRIRIIEIPNTPYTEWELKCYRIINIPGGEQVYTINKNAACDLNLPNGDLMMFDDHRAAICAYDKTHRMITQTFYDENDDITDFLMLKRKLLSIAQPL